MGTLHSHSLAFMSTDLSVAHSNSVSRSAKALDRLRSNSSLLVVLFIHRITGGCKVEFYSQVTSPYYQSCARNAAIADDTAGEVPVHIAMILL